MNTNTDQIYQLIGEKVRAFRKQRELSQGQLANKLGITRTSVVNIELGKQRPPMHVLWSIADSLEVEVHSLIPSRAELNESNSIVLSDEIIPLLKEKVKGNKKNYSIISGLIGELEHPNED